MKFETKSIKIQKQIMGFGKTFINLEKDHQISKKKFMNLENIQKI